MRELNIKEVDMISGGVYDYFFPVMTPNEVMTGYGIEITYETITRTERTGWFSTTTFVETVPHIKHKEVIEQRLVF